MQEEICNLLQLTFLQTTDNEQIQAATNRLTELSQSPEFYTSLIQIILNQSLPVTVKSASIIRLSQEIYNKWGELPAELHSAIISTLPNILSTITDNTVKTISHYSRLVVKFAYSSGEYSHVVNDIQTLVSNQATVLAGMILLKSFSSVVSDKLLPEEVQLAAAEILIPILLNFLQTTDNFIYAGYILICFSHILTNPNVTQFDENFQILVQVLDKALLIKNAVDQPDYHFFAKSATKFLIIFIDRFLVKLDQTIIEPIINIACEILSASACIPYVRANLLRIIYQLIRDENLGIYEYFIHPNAQDFFNQCMHPQFLISEEDLQTALEDPKTFVDEIHKSSSDFNDSRETAGLIIKHLAEHNPDSTEPIFNTLMIGIKMFADSNEDASAQAGLFSYAHFFSFAADSFARYSKPLLANFVAQVSPLFEHESVIVRSAAFLTISDIHCHLTAEIAQACIERSGDSESLVRYYCQRAAANLLEKIPEETMADQIRQNLSVDVTDIMSTILQTSNEYSDADFTHVLNQIVVFFGEMLLPSAAEIAAQLCALISQSGQQPISDEEALDNVIKLNQSLATLVELVANQGRGVESFAHDVLVLCIQALQEMTNPEAVDPFLETVCQILECCNTINPEFWKMIEPLAKHFGNPEFNMPVGAICDILNLMISKDPEFYNREEVCEPVVNFLMELMKNKLDLPESQGYSSWNELAKVAEAILIKVPTESPYIAEFLPAVSLMIQRYIQEVDTLYFDYDGAILAMNGVLYNNVAAAQAALGDDFPNFLENWVENIIFPDSYVCLIKNFGALAPDLQMIAMKNLIGQTFDDILSKSVENGDEFDQDIERDGVVWFDFGETLLLFNQFLGEAMKTFPDMIAEIESYFDPEAWADLGRLPEVAQLYINTRNGKLRE